MPSIMIVDDERHVREMLAEYLARSYDVACATNGAEALAFLDGRSVDLVISDITMPGMDGIELLSAVRTRHPRTKYALLTGHDINHFIKADKKEYIANIIPKTAPFNFDELDTIVRGLITGEIFGLSRYLLHGGTPFAQYRITSMDDGRQVREELVARIEKRFGDAKDLRLVLDEIITNAILHAPATADGSDKYRHVSTIALEPDEHVDVECGFDKEKYGVSITDRKGRLKKETVIHKMERHISGDGVLDESGRGIHLSRLFADRLVINIDPGRKTEVIIMNYFAPSYLGPKPLYINEL
ncbi:MAG: response regulator [Chitinispirillaceae bacterium]|nr:response regulator [Chitinispirillaceae bacterium]